MHQAQLPLCILFDNGSLRAASTLQLRETAAALAENLGISVVPVSLLHSSAVDPTTLGGSPAELLESALTAYLGEHPDAQVVLLPLFFGPSGALSDYLPERLATWQKHFPYAKLHLADCLVRVSDGDQELAQELATATRSAICLNALKLPSVVLVDHGSPKKEVTDVRDHLGRQLRALLGSEVRCVGVAAMERRKGEEFAFNEPLLSRCLATPPFDAGEVVLALQFLAPGRHAGPGGDIASICAEACRARPALRTFMTTPIGSSPGVVAVLARRYREAVQSGFRGSISPTSNA